MSARALRTEKLDIRLSSEIKRAFETAASVRHQTVTAFVVESALSRAEETLADRRAFMLNKPQWNAFLNALDAPVRQLPRVQRLLTEPGVFDNSNSHSTVPTAKTTERR